MLIIAQFLWIDPSALSLPYSSRPKQHHIAHLKVTRKKEIQALVEDCKLEHRLCFEEAVGF